MKFSLPLTALAFFSLGLTGAVRAQSFTYTDFSNSSALTLNGSAQVVAGAVASDGQVLRLTPANYFQAGSAFSTTQIPLTNTSFSTAFNFRITNSGGAADTDGAGADGIVFVIQPISNNVGSAGGGIGYQGISNSLGIEFDTWNNGTALGDQNDGNHVAVNINGVLSDSFLTPISTRMNNGQLWSAWVDYNGNTNDLQIRLAQTNVRPDTALIDTTSINLASVLGQNQAYIGFTSGTGAAYANHDIVSWQFNNDYQPISQVGATVPDATSTSMLLVIGFASLIGGALWRRRGARA